MMEDENKKPIQLYVRTKAGNLLPLNELPAAKKQKENYQLAEQIANSLSKERKIKRLFKEYDICDYINPKQIILSASSSMINDGVINVRETKTPKINYDKFRELKKSLEKSQKIIDRFGEGLFNDFSMAVQRYELDVKAVPNLMRACDDIIKYRSYPRAPYYSALIGTFQLFYSCRLDRIKYIPFQEQAISNVEWDFFKKLVTHIQFQIAEHINLQYTCVQDTRKGLEGTFRKLRERNPNYFCD